MRPSRFSTVVAFAAFAVAIGAALKTSHARVVNVDFNITSGTAGTYVGTAVAPDTGTKWNGLDVGAQLSTVASFGPASLVDSNNDPTTVALSVQNFRPFEDGGPALATALLQDLVAGVSADTPSTPSPVTFSITGLVDGRGYDLYLYSENGTFNNAHTRFTINAISQDVDNPGPGTFVSGQNYVKYSGLQSVGGIISGSVATTVSNNAASWNGFQIVELPEPAAAGVIFVFGAIALRRRATRR